MMPVADYREHSQALAKIIRLRRNRALDRQDFFSLLLRLLLLETRRYGQSRQIAEFAAGVWRRMTPAQRSYATGATAYTWIKAMEVLYLHHTGQEEEIRRLLRQLPVSVRRVGRALRAMELEMEPPPAEEGDKEP